MILVTGATGFVGHQLMRQLMAKNYAVTGLARNPDGGHRVEGLTYLTGDILKPETLRDAMTQEVDTIIHLVGILADKPTCSFDDVHHQGTRHVVEAAKAAGVQRYIQMSSLGTRANARARYHQSKWLAEEYLRQSGLDYTIFRPSVIFGAEDNFVNTFAQMARFSPMLPLLGNGQSKMQPIAVEDVVRCMVQSLELPETVGQTYALGGPEVLTFEQIISTILKVTGQHRLKLKLPFALLKLEGRIFEKLLSNPPLTYDQMIMAEEDNITSHGTQLPAPFDFKLRTFEAGIRDYIG
uniref:NAD-dependent epimerase/dehydratase.Putative UDP-N-acetylglucosamine 4-epimerase n=1 Tax=Magnetococcus massalia (strain MO-1) TaxID=451514 RepID=A0A1S7LFT1_MAGMO|nr:NAD-dependent epimerase/dehydratase.Putative UDP-N-acetylglucosamine 4-epimerase [Candidatus Magnetococcus massalia]